MKSLGVFFLGGLDEVGNFSIGVTTEEEIFLFDAGISMLSDVDLGANALTPNFEYLRRQKSKIRGLFLTQVNLESAGSVSFLLKALPQLKIFAGPIAAELLRNSNLLTMEQKEHNLVEMPERKMSFNSAEIERFDTAAPSIGSSGWIVKTGLGRLIYTGNFVTQIQRKGALFESDLRSILTKRENDKEETLFLIGNVSEIEREGFTWPDCQPQPALSSCIENTEEHLFVGCFEDDWYKIYTSTLWFSKEYKIVDFYVFDPKFRKLLERTFERFAPKLSGVRFHDFSELKREPGVKKIIFVTGDQRWYFSRLVSLGSETDRLTEQDTIALLGDHIFNSEKAMTNILDTLHHSPAKIRYFSDSVIRPFKASKEDIKLLFGLVSPRFFIPFGSLFSQFVAAKEAISEIDESLQKSTIIGKNGMFFQVREDLQLQISKIDPHRPVFVDSRTFDPLTETSILDRKTLGNEGAVIVFFTNKTTLTPSKVPGHDWKFQIETMGLEIEPKELRTISDMVQNMINNWRHSRKDARFDLKNEMKRIRNFIETKIHILIGRAPLIEFISDLY